MALLERLAAKLPQGSLGEEDWAELRRLRALHASQRPDSDASPASAAASVGAGPARHNTVQQQPQRGELLALLTLERGGRGSVALAQHKGWVTLRRAEVRGYDALQKASARSMRDQGDTGPRFFRAVTSDNTVLRGELHGRPDADDKVFFLMGFGGSREWWDEQVLGSDGAPSVCSRIDAEVCTFDNRGAGDSDRPWGLYTTRLLAEDAISVLRAIDWLAPGTKLHLVGHSMGAMVCQHLACMLTEAALSDVRVESACFLATHTGDWRILPPLLSVRHMLLAGCHGALNRPEALVRTLLPLLHSPAYCKSAVCNGKTGAEHQEPAYASRPPATEHLWKAVPGVIGHAAAVGTHHVPAQRLRQLPQRGVRCAVVLAERDGVIDPCHSVSLADTLGCPLHRVDGGHMLLQENPNEVNSRIAQTIRGDGDLHAVPQPWLNMMGGVVGFAKYPMGKATFLGVRTVIGVAKGIGVLATALPQPPPRVIAPFRVSLRVSPSR
eukprot:TRINITY_DN49974_c0_g1_i1.p1 TRINITY_DN49974_c0_g1~~TRINITY_DN49974_c0_g1_i1.p1  ORF type:complete len:565 (+),score=119.56 TRINITY_DN49974_c0_g1_i1:208-1695(+)